MSLHIRFIVLLPLDNVFHSFGNTLIQVYSLTGINRRSQSSSFLNPGNPHLDTGYIRQDLWPDKALGAATAKSDLLRPYPGNAFDVSVFTQRLQGSIF